MLFFLYFVFLIQKKLQRKKNCRLQELKNQRKTEKTLSQKTQEILDCLVNFEGKNSEAIETFRISKTYGLEYLETNYKFHPQYEHDKPTSFLIELNNFFIKFKTKKDIIKKQEDNKNKATRQDLFLIFLIIESLKYLQRLTQQYNVSSFDDKGKIKLQKIFISIFKELTILVNKFKIQELEIIDPKLDIVHMTILLESLKSLLLRCPQ